MDTGAIVVCRKCKKQARINELRQDAGSWICQICYEKAHFYPEPKSTSFREISERKPQVTSERGGVKLFRCGNCGYHLQGEHVDNKKVCPYCGDKGTLRIA